MTRDETKRLYKAYCERARDIVKVGDEHFRELSITVEEGANVQMTEDGAFVECHVWVPKELL